MADKKEKNKAEKEAEKKIPTMVLVGPLMCALVFLPTTLIFVTMMLPTAIAFIVDRSRPRALATTVGTINFSGTIAGWLELISRGHNMENAQALATDLDYLLIAYGSALLGYIIYATVVPMVGRISSRAAEIEKNRIQHKQEALKNIWGPDVGRGISGLSEK